MNSINKQKGKQTSYILCESKQTAEKNKIKTLKCKQTAESINVNKSWNLLKNPKNIYKQLKM